MHHHLLADLRSGVRMLVKFPTLSLAAIVTLGVGIGLSTTVFCVVNGAMWKGLPFPDAGRIVALQNNKPAERQFQLMSMSILDVAVMKDRQSCFEKIGEYASTALNFSTEEGRPERLAAGMLTVAAFEVFGVQPILGRGFQPGDDRGGHDAIIILGYRVWQERFGGSPAVIGHTVRANGVVRTVIGVMPERFAFPLNGSAWIPLVILPPRPRGQEARFEVVARLRPGVSVRQANAQISAIGADLAREFPQTNQGMTAEVVPYADTALGPELVALLYTMLGAGLGVLLIACVNVSNLLLARASLRRKEIAVRMALGAAGHEVILQHLTEVLVLAICGSAIGVLLSMAGMRWFTDAIAATPPPFWITFELDYRVMLFVLGLIVLTSFMAGGLPAFHAARVSAGAVLKDDSRGSTSAGLGRFSSALVVAELAISCGLLIAAGLMTKSVTQLRNVPMPFAVDNVLTARVDLPRDRYRDSAARIRFYEQLLPRLRALAPVESATLSDGLPAAGNGVVRVQTEGKSYSRDADAPAVREGIVTDGYFETFQTTLLAGRGFARSDTAASQRVAIINASFARTQFPNVDPIGHQMRRLDRDAEEPWLTIVGVVPDLLMEGIGNNNSSPAGYYIPIAQSDVATGVRIAVRARGDAASVTPFLRSAVASLDPDLAIYEIDTLRHVIDRRTWFYRVFGTFFMAFGACGLLLAAAGLYGVMSFAVTQRTREMGVRSALGAQGRQLIALVMRRSVIQLAIGLFLGLALALLASGALQPVLYHVSPRDAVVFALVTATLAITALLATLLPASRVTRIDPVVALSIE